MEGNPFHLDLNSSQPWPPEAAWLTTYAGTWFAAATVMVMQRLLLRTFKYGSPLGLDDALIFCSWLASIALFVESAIAVGSLDQGVPVQPSKFEFIFFMLWLIEGTFVISQCCIKLAVLAILNRFIKDTANTRIRYAIYGAATLTATYSLAMIIVGFTACQPFYGFWRSLDRNWAAHHSVRCISKTTMMLVAGILAVVSDLYTIAIPWAISRSFGLSKRQTLALNTVFMVGLIVTAASCMRTYYLYCLYLGNNLSHDVVSALIWATVEIQLAIICACLPSLRVVYRLIVQTRLSDRVRQLYYSHGTRDPHVLTSSMASMTTAPTETTWSIQSGILHQDSRTLSKLEETPISHELGLREVDNDDRALQRHLGHE
ncbi:unnamed protein product [Zymoseptoria tritici ST99CH_3D7]|uniref:Rhodopsin domain-containing protein n=4 Tax=Zymoseptoria tritici TaxID=1047171 RepID=A0A1X7RVN1_ZYMT9|nr:unnamed protein product [Zymoseptoria tritici ST99CH_3D7]